MKKCIPYETYTTLSDAFAEFYKKQKFESLSEEEKNKIDYDNFTTEVNEVTNNFMNALCSLTGVDGVTVYSGDGIEQKI